MHVTLLQLVEALVLGAVLSSFSDWYFYGRKSLHRYYFSFPGVWKKIETKRQEVRSILLASLTSLASCAVFIGTAAWLGVTGFAHALVLGVLFWAAGPLMHLVSCLVYMNLDRTIALNHALGWLLRFVACAVAIAIFW